jgi:hypothetical protein
MNATEANYDWVEVEFYAVPRLRAGVAACRVPAGALADVLRAVLAQCPGLAPLLPDGQPGPHVLVSLDGQRFLHDPGEPIPPGARLLVLSADVGG